MDKNEIHHIAKLARLKFNDSDTIKMEKNLNDIISWVALLQSADTSSITNSNEEEKPLRQREDKVKVGGMSKELLENAPAKYESFFTVPKVVE